jgi:hypothetical protein
MPYTPLKERDEFRLIRLKPRIYKHRTTSAQTVAVFCTLEHSFVGKIPYVALSYVWGDENDRRLIFVNDEPVQIGINLEKALRELRHGTEDVILWADQLCINQDDNIEKSQQVQQMKSFYAQADHVIAWIGPAADDSAELFSLLKRTAQNVTERRYDQIFEDHEPDRILPFVSYFFKRFCEQSYWSRLWIMQEFTVGRHVEVVWGSVSISYLELSVLSNAIFIIPALQEYTGTPRTYAPANEPTKFISRMCTAYGAPALSFVQSVLGQRMQHNQESLRTDGSFFHVLISSLILDRDYNHPNCSDPRDRIFSLLGLANDADFFDGIIDYSKSCEDIYETTARKFLDQGHIDILSFCQFPKASDMATWVPDWRQPTRRPCTDTYSESSWTRDFSASGGSLTPQQISYIVTHTAPRAVTLCGTFVDTIRATGTSWDPNWLEPLHPHLIKIYLGEILTFCQESPRVRDYEEHLDTARIAIADRMHCTDPKSQKSCLTSYQQLLQTLNSTETQHDSNLDLSGTAAAESTYTRWIRLLHSRKPFISQTGFVGLSPMHVIPGDVICVFLGGRTPYILRQREDSNYDLVGEAYVHGIMYGEFMEGNPDLEMITLQ